MIVECPETMRGHVQKVLNGEYNIPLKLPAGSTVLDIGANVGAFALWASSRWPDAAIHCFEPSKANFEFLRKNTEGFESKITLNNFAVGNTEHTTLYKGRNNCGESSFFQLGEQMVDSETVETQPPSVLPKCDILKVDTEGSEMAIIPAYVEQHLPKAIMFEYHREADRIALDTILNKNYFLVKGTAERLHRGVFKYMLKELCL